MSNGDMMNPPKDNNFGYTGHFSPGENVRYRWYVQDAIEKNMQPMNKKQWWLSGKPKKAK